MEGCLKISALLLLLPTLAFADAVNNEWHSTTRNLSMGNVGIASSEDPTSAAFYNPAALARAKKASFEVFNPQFDMGLGVFGLGDAKGISKHMSLDKIQPELKKNPGKASSIGAAIYPNLYIRNFNLGVLLSRYQSSYSDGTTTYYRYRSLVMPSLGISAAIFSGRFRLGVAARGIRWTDNDRDTTDTTNFSYTRGAGKGWGVALDGGVHLTMPWKGLPTIGVVARNIGGTKIAEGQITDAPLTGQNYHINPLPMTFDVGFAIFPKVGQRSTLTMAVDYRDLHNNTKTSTLRHVNAGMELSIVRTLYLRAGVSRGYWTAGIGLASKLGSLDIGTYAEELHRSDFRAQEDRRVSFRYGSRF